MASLTEFTGFYSHPNTAASYRTALIHYFSLLYNQRRQGRQVTPEEIEEYDRLSKLYLTEDRDHASDLMRFAVLLAHAPPKTSQKYMAAVRQFLIENDIEIKPRTWKRIRSKLARGGARTMEREIDRPLLKEVFLHLDTKAKAFFLFQASSGMRPGEVLKLELDDLELDQDPAQINIRGEITKNGEPRISFLSSEAAEALRAWLRIRERYIRSSRNRCAGLLPNRRPTDQDDPRVFPFSYTVVIKSWTLAVKKAGHFSQDKSTGRMQIHPHMLRKFFLSQFTGDNTKHGEALAGHSGYLTDAYRRIPRADLAAEYKKVEPRLTILAPGDYGELNERDRAALQRQAEMISRLSAEKEALESRLLALEGDVKAMREFEIEIRKELQAEP